MILYDFGNIIYISAEDRQLFKELVYLLVVQNNNAAIRILKRLGVTILDTSAMIEYLKLYVDYIKTLDIDIIYNSHNPDVKLPLVLNDKIFRLIRVFSILEGVCKKLSKDFSYLDLLDEYTAMIFMDVDFLVFKASRDIGTVMSNDDMADGDDDIIREYKHNIVDDNKKEHPHWAYATIGLLAIANLLHITV